MSEALDKQIRIVLNKKLNKEEPVPAIVSSVYIYIV
jgi:hypothetical protein